MVRAGAVGYTARMSLPGLPTSADDVAALEAAVRWHASGEAVVLATILSTWGSAPRGAGSHMAMASDGSFVGSVSGGCVEGALMRTAAEVRESGGPRIVEYGVSNDQAWEAGLACGGQVVVRLDRIGSLPLDLPTTQLQAILDAVADRQPVALRFEPGQAARRVSARPTDTTSTVPRRSDVRTHPVVRPYPPTLRLVMVGAGHITRALVGMALPLGFELHVIDPRSAFARSDRFPGATVHVDYPDEVLDHLGVDAHTAVVVLTHDPRIDDPALEVALRSTCVYIGALGSTRTHARRRTRLADRGFDSAALDRIHGPVGLRLGGRQPAEIALSILAELTQVRHGRSA